MYVDKLDDIKDEMRKDAIENAREKADQLASELGVSLDKIVSFSESGNNNYQPRLMYKMGMASDMALAESIDAPEINPGTQKITKTVSITFQIQD